MKDLQHQWLSKMPLLEEMQPMEEKQSVTVAPPHVEQSGEIVT
jgi:hypothetical protein